jgi:hypothetical protein
MMFYGFLDKRERVTRRYPLFYTVTQRTPPELAGSDLDLQAWTPVARVYADACYVLWVQSLLLEFIAVAGGLQKLQQTHLNRWYELPEFLLFAARASADAILWAMNHPGQGIDFADSAEGGVLNFQAADMPLITDSIEWRIVFEGPSQSDDDYLTYDAANASTQTGVMASFTHSEHFDTVRSIAELFNEIDPMFGQLFNKQAIRILDTLMKANPAADFPEIIIHAWRDPQDPCRCDVFVELLVHVIAFMAVMKEGKLHLDALQVLTEGSPALAKYERTYLANILLAIASSILGRSEIKIEEVKDEKMLANDEGMDEDMDKGMDEDMDKGAGDSIDEGDDKPTPLYVSDEPTIKTMKLRVFVHQCPLAAGSGSRRDLAHPHVYAYLSHGLSIPTGWHSPRFMGSDLEKMYGGAAGCMEELKHPVAGGGLIADLELTHMLIHNDEPVYLCFMIFYEVVSQNKRDQQPIVRQYAVISRGYARIDLLGEIEAAVEGMKVTTFAGPMSSNYSIHTDDESGEIGGIKKDFAYTADCVLTLSARKQGDVQQHTQPDAAPASLLLDRDDEQYLNQYAEHLYKMTEAAHITNPQSFIYKGIPGVIAPLIFGSFLSSGVDMPTLNRSLDRALARMRITEDQFIALLEKEQESAWGAMRVKHVVIEALNLVNSLFYTNDRVFEMSVDVHQDVRLTNNGDCEDFAWALYGILRKLTDPYWEPPMYDGQSKGMTALIEKLRREKLQPMFVSMYIDYPTSNMHSAVILVGERGNYMFEGTGPHHGDFCTIQEFSEEQRGSVIWYDMIHKAVKAQNKAARDRIFTMYPPPVPSIERRFDTGQDEHFYKGFLGGVIGNQYMRFIEKGGDIGGLKEEGIDVCSVINTHDYDLVPVPSVDDQAMEYYTKTVSEMQYLSGLAPPLPPNAPSSDTPYENMPAGVVQAVEVFRKTVKSPKVSNDNTQLLMDCIPIFYNLHGRTLSDVEAAAKMLQTAVNSTGKQMAAARVHAFSNFPGAWTVEIDVFRE